MARLTTTVRNIVDNVQTLRQWDYGVIITRNGRLEAIQLRLWPKLVSVPEAVWWGQWRHRQPARDQADVCTLYYNHPRRHRRFLALKYVYSTAGTTLATFRCAVTALDKIGEIKGVDAMLCEVTNSRISHRLMQRWGWERHVPRSSRRHYIKRLTPPQKLDTSAFLRSITSTQSGQVGQICPSRTPHSNPHSP